jgi:hypothetical protein
LKPVEPEFAMLLEMMAISWDAICKALRIVEIMNASTPVWLIAVRSLFNFRTKTGDRQKILSSSEIESPKA